MIESKTIAENYIASWNNTPDARTAAMTAWAEDACYVDPMMSGEGRAGIARMIDDAVKQFPGHRFTLCTEPDGHGAYVRFSWKLAPASGAAVARGTDIVRVDSEGRIAEVIGFLDEVVQ